MLDERTKELVAIGAAITAHCQPCLEYHSAKARELGGVTEDILAAIEVGQQVRRGAAAKMDNFAKQHVGGQGVPDATAGCGCR